MTVISPAKTKLCKRCGVEKPASAFRPRKDVKDGLWYCCRECDKKRTKEVYHKNPDWWRDSQYRRQYGITLDDWNQMFQSQHGKCAVCGTKSPGGMGKRFHVDHCHETGKVRGLLCYACNTALGLLKHSLPTLEAASEYLSRHTA